MTVSNLRCLFLSKDNGSKIFYGSKKNNWHNQLCMANSIVSFYYPAATVKINLFLRLLKKYKYFRMTSKFITDGESLGGTSRAFLAVKSSRAEVSARCPRWLHAANGLLRGRQCITSYARRAFEVKGLLGHPINSSGRSS